MPHACCMSRVLCVKAVQALPCPAIGVYVCCLLLHLGCRSPCTTDELALGLVYIGMFGFGVLLCRLCGVRWSADTCMSSVT